MTQLMILTSGDNYIYLLHDNTRAAVIDPTAAEPVADCLQRRHLTLETVLCTHHHSDHTGGNAALKRAWHCEILGPGRRVPHLDRLLHDRETVRDGLLDIRVMATPGHTLDSVCYYCPGTPGWVFTGDTLFVGGCGRLFEGTAGQMHRSLQSLLALPEETLVYAGHDYALDNFAFAASVAPHDQPVLERKAGLEASHRNGAPLVPSTLKLEKSTNLFLRASNEQAFASLRLMKDRF